MADRDQTRPLDPAAFRTSSTSREENGGLSPHQSKKSLRRRKGLLCCGCASATILIIGLIILILAFTVFKVKNPELDINSVRISGLDLALRAGSTNRGVNMTFISDISVKNPNAASFKFKNATTELYYGGRTIGEVQSPPGNARAQKTVHLNVTVDVMVDEVTRVSRLTSDLASGQMPIVTYTFIPGRVNILNIIKKHIDVDLNCTMNVVISTQSIADKKCKRKVRM